MYSYIYSPGDRDSYQRLKKWYLMPPCLTLSIIRYGSRVKWSNPGNGVAPSPTPRCRSYWKGSLRIALDYGRQHTHTHTHTHTHIYIYIYVYVRGAFNKFPDFFCTGIWHCRRLFKIQYLIAIHLMRWLTNFYDFSFKWTATVAIGIHLTKAWLLQLVNFKNAIWTWGRTICNKILF